MEHGHRPRNFDNNFVCIKLYQQLNLNFDKLYMDTVFIIKKMLSETKKQRNLTLAVVSDGL